MTDARREDLRQAGLKRVRSVAAFCHIVLTRSAPGGMTIEEASR